MAGRALKEAQQTGELSADLNLQEAARLSTAAEY
jgi:hypothetical protein